MKSPRIIAVGNNKGGVGKTFVSKTLAEYAVLVRGLKVLLLDLDPQTNLSRRYLDMLPLREAGEIDEYAPPVHHDYAENPNDPEFAGWNGLSDTADIWLSAYSVFYPTPYENLHILPAHARRLQDIELVRKQDVYDQVVHRLREFLTLPGIVDDYDLVIIDTRPSKGPLVQAAMHAATHLLIPSEMEPPSVEGLHGMLSVRTQVNLHRPKTDPLRLIGILPNKFRAGVRIHDEYLSILSQDTDIGKYMLPVVLNDWVGYKASMLFGSDSLFRSSTDDKHQIQLKQVCSAIFDRMEAAQ